MGVEAELAVQVYRLMELHRRFAQGEYEEMNSMYAEDFQGSLYRPGVGQLETFDVAQIRQGNRDTAAHFKGKDMTFVFSGLKIVPQEADAAAVSYEITYRDEQNMVRALNLEGWRRAEGHWEMVRWHQEDGSAQ